MQQNAPTNLYVEKTIPNFKKIPLSISTKQRADEPDMLHGATQKFLDDLF